MPISDSLLQLIQLIKNNIIPTINLFGEQIGDNGASVLAEALVMDTGVERINLSNNQIGDDGAIALARFLTQSVICDLKITSNPIQESGIRNLIEAALASETLENNILEGLPYTPEMKASIDAHLEKNRITKGMVSQSLKTFLHFTKDTEPFKAKLPLALTADQSDEQQHSLALHREQYDLLRNNTAILRGIISQERYRDDDLMDFATRHLGNEVSQGAINLTFGAVELQLMSLLFRGPKEDHQPRQDVALAVSMGRSLNSRINPDDVVKAVFGIFEDLLQIEGFASNDNQSETEASNPYALDCGAFMDYLAEASGRGGVSTLPNDNVELTGSSVPSSSAMDQID